ncbi:MAG: FAD-binding protein [Verrucomicrobia bacterium]|nr:FAD-binding protein [Verrucomicrobiota bacterium]
MSALLEPVSPAELAEAVKSAPRVLAVGAGTKPRLSALGADVVRISTLKLSGIVEYEPSEFTFTALAGTRVKEIVAALGERGQYLPFDPLLADAGATIGGTVAAGLGGPGRFRFGGLRDFILGVRFVDGGGRLMRLGGKVVKNAAGFDLPKFFVGSLGRFGALAEVTFKVFPRAVTTRTLRLPAADAKTVTEIFTTAAGQRWELDALEASPADGAVYARLAGPAAAALDALAAEIFARWRGTTLTEDEAAKVWGAVREFGWAHADGEWVKVALVPSQVEEFLTRVRDTAGARVWLGLGGNVGFASWPKGAKPLADWPWPAMTLRGAGPLWAGKKDTAEVFRAVKVALDPQNRFPSLED